MIFFFLSSSSPKKAAAAAAAAERVERGGESQNIAKTAYLFKIHHTHISRYFFVVAFFDKF
jgi:hypothetical protein